MHFPKHSLSIKSIITDIHLFCNPVYAFVHFLLGGGLNGILCGHKSFERNHSILHLSYNYNEYETFTYRDAYGR